MLETSYEKMLLNKIWLQKYKFYRQLPMEIRFNIETAYWRYELTKRYTDITINWHDYKWRKKEFNRLLKVFYLIPNQ